MHEENRRVVLQRSKKRCGCLLSYSQAEPGREFTQTSPRLLAEPCIGADTILVRQLNGGQNVSFLRKNETKTTVFGPPFASVPARPAPCCSKYTEPLPNFVQPCVIFDAGLCPHETSCAHSPSFQSVLSTSSA